ncbi:MAG: hypothetical protein IT176_01165 [Acidobacteria bacterium]|nr:hypothetical protein [Acidobacteriota bacterium]
MKHVQLNLPTFAFVVSTRAALGAGIGMLVAGRMSAERRRRIGATLVAIGAAATLPAIMAIRRCAHELPPAETSDASPNPA